MESKDREQQQQQPEEAGALPCAHPGHESPERLVGEGPQNQPSDGAQPPQRFRGAEGGMQLDEPATDDSDRDTTLDQDDSVESLHEMNMACESPAKVNANLLVDRLRQLIRNPTTWRIVKGLVVLALAVKLFNSYDAVQQYIPSVFGQH